ncbi:MAG: nickel/cobalt transporter, partial [Burkholderiaceae bacterium]
GGLLIGLSFAYGVFHALGPGHGKAVIASYVLANRQTARNGAVLAFAASLVQAMVAIAVVSVLALVFNVTAGVMNEATRWLEITAYAMVMVLGLMLVWRKALRPLIRGRHSRGLEQGPGDRRSHDAHGHAPNHGHSHSHSHSHGHGHGHVDGNQHHTHSHDHDECCGHAHVPPPETMAGALSLRRAWVAILAIGLRPCSGALIVLVFALAQDFYFAGVASALAMGVGTGLTVAMLAVLSVWAGSATTRLGGLLSSRAAIWVRYAIESTAAVLVLALGVLLLGATLFGSGMGG